MSALLEIRDVSYDYMLKNIVTHAVRNVSAEFEQGSFYTISGRSGSGKSTLLSLICALNRPISGDIIYDGNSILSLNPDDYRRKHLGIIYQSFYLFPQLNALENVMLPMEFDGQREGRDERAKELLLRVGLNESHMKKRPDQLSGGEQQRVALARALANNADIIIADEPTGNVDPQMSLEIVELLTRLNEAGTTVIMVTHAHDLVKRFDKRVITLQGGEVVSDGAIENGELPAHASTHLNSEKESLEEKFTHKPEEPVQSQKEDDVDEAFLNAIISDTDSYRIYIEQDAAKKDGEKQ